MHNQNTQPPQALFKPFSWHVNPDYTADEILAATTRDVAYGIQFALEMIERDELAPDNGDTPILNDADRSILLRLAIASAGLLGGAAELNIESRNQRKRKAGGAHG